KPVPLDLFARRVFDHRHRAVLRDRTRLALRAQTAVTDLARQRWIRLFEAKAGELIEQGQRPQMRVLAEACTDVVLEPLEAVLPARRPDAGLASDVQIRPDRLAIAVQVPRDRRDRPAPLV